MTTEQPEVTETPETTDDRSWRQRLSVLVLITAVVTFGVTAVLVSIFERKQEARVPFVRLVEVDEVTTDPRPWGVNWPYQYDSYRRTVDTEETQHGGSSAMPESKLESNPWLRRLYAGYAFSIDYREARGHAYMLFDQEVTERVTMADQPGACLHCHASVIPTYRRLGLEASGQPADAEALAADYDWSAVMDGFRLLGAMDYHDAHAELLKTPDGTPTSAARVFPGGAARPGAQATSEEDGEVEGELGDPHLGAAHPVSCVDCHDPETMRIRVTRPGFMQGIAKLAESDDPLPHLPSIEEWRKGSRSKPYDPNELATRREMRSFVCGQCHVEYYCGPKETLFYPWDNGLKVEQIEKTLNEHTFPDGSEFLDYVHGETGAPVFKAQHPEFELWNQGIHARSGVSCADCHMPYERQGAMKVSSHWVGSPLLNLNRACQVCHNVSEEELKLRVKGIQQRTEAHLQRAAAAMTDMLDAIRDAQAAGATEEQLVPIFELQKKGMWRLDFISSENSLGFHADQEAMRILGESIDYCRQAEAMALRLRAPEPPEHDLPRVPVKGVTPTDRGDEGAGGGESTD